VTFSIRIIHAESRPGEISSVSRHTQHIEQKPGLARDEWLKQDARDTERLCSKTYYHVQVRMWRSAGVCWRDAPRLAVLEPLVGLVTSVRVK
jgi:hypothetical protein